MGGHFENFNKTWLKKILQIQYPNITLESAKYFKDPTNIVNKKSAMFEEDIYSEDPKVICETTTFLKAGELDKVYKLLRIKNYFDSQRVY